MKQFKKSIKSNGFTLIELMVVLAILSILSLVAAPNFISFVRNSELTSTTNSFIGAISTARSEAMKRNTYVLVTPRTGNQWSSGWKIFVDKNFNATFDAGETIISESNDVPEKISITGNGTARSSAQPTPYLLFDGSGFFKRSSGNMNALTFQLQINDSSANNSIRRIKIASTGRVRSCTPTSSNDANCSGISGTEDGSAEAEFDAPDSTPTSTTE